MGDIKTKIGVISIPEREVGAPNIIVQKISNSVLGNILKLVVKPQDFTLAQTDQGRMMVCKAVWAEMHIPHGGKIAVSVFTTVIGSISAPIFV